MWQRCYSHVSISLYLWIGAECSCPQREKRFSKKVFVEKGFFSPTRHRSCVGEVSGILLRLFQSIKHRQRLVFLRNRLRESTLANRRRPCGLVSWAWLQSDSTPAERRTKWINFSYGYSCSHVPSGLSQTFGECDCPLWAWTFVVHPICPQKNEAGASFITY